MSLFGKKKNLINPIYKCQKSNWPSATRFLREKLKKKISLRLSNFGSKMVKNYHLDVFFFFLFSLLMDQGHDQQQHPTVHGEGMSRRTVQGCCTWKMIFFILIFLSVLLPANVKRFSVSCMQIYFFKFKFTEKVCKFHHKIIRNKQQKVCLTNFGLKILTAIENDS